MSKLRNLISWKYFFIFYFPTSVLLGFQNCSQVDFSADASSVNQVLNSDLTLEKGLEYTNKKIIDVEISANTSIYSSMKISMNNDFSGAQSQPVNKTFKYDLGDQYAADGSKDGVKSIYVELTGSGVPTKIMNQNIGLDTIHPSISPEGILAKGLQGLAYTHQESVNIGWQGGDVPAPTGFRSGIDPVKGLKVAYSKVEDCSTSQVTILQDWSGYQDYIRVSWPQKNPLDSLFYE